MRAVIQRVTHASVKIEDEGKGNGKANACGEDVRSIRQGFLVLLGVCEEDGMEDVEWLVKKIANLRVFNDEEGVMNRSILEVQGEVLVVSQFTLYASYKKGNRPSWFRAGSHLHSPLRGLLYAARRANRKTSCHRRIRCRHEGGIAQRRAGDDLYGYKE